MWTKKEIAEFKDSVRQEGGESIIKVKACCQMQFTHAITAMHCVLDVLSLIRRANVSVFQGFTVGLTLVKKTDDYS